MEEKLIRAAKPIGWLALAMGVISAWAVIFYAPVEKIQGPIQKIMYIHVPSAIAAYASFTVVAVSGGFYLVQKREVWDRVARCAAEIGILFCSIVLGTGPFWGKAIWGAWWVWDAKLTSTLILWLVYISYFILRRAVPSEQGARFAAVLGIVGLLDVPFIHVAADKFRTLHPPNVMKGGMTPEMGLTLVLSIGAVLLFMVYLLARRVEIEGMRDEIRSIEASMEPA